MYLNDNGIHGKEYIENITCAYIYVQFSSMTEKNWKVDNPTHEMFCLMIMESYQDNLC